MSTCRDCFNYSLCHNRGVMFYEGAKDEVETGCIYFKNKSKIVELPCKVGDTLFFIDEIIKLQGRKKVHYEIGEECIVDNIKIGQQMIPYVNACTKDNRWIMFCADDFGKNVFTSKKEAKNTLNNIKNKGEEEK